MERTSGVGSVLLQIISLLAARLTSLALGLVFAPVSSPPHSSARPAESRDWRPGKGAWSSSSAAQESNNG